MHGIRVINLAKLQRSLAQLFTQQGNSIEFIILATEFLHDHLSLQIFLIAMRA